MELTEAERWILVNQYRILEALQPANAYGAHDLANARSIVERGYQYLYQEVSGIWSSVVTEEESEEVVSILQMFRILLASYNNLPDTEKQGVNTSYTTFRGFDGNNKGAQFSFAQFFCLEMGRFSEFQGVDFNSHSQLLPKYRRMLTRLNATEYDGFLNAEQITDITSA